MPINVLIFVFAGVSSGRSPVILAEFAPVPNLPSDSPSPASVAAGTPDVRALGTQTDPAHRVPLAEIGGPSGPEPTRFGDWEKNGRCVDF
jgi:hypothetical protein